MHYILLVLMAVGAVALDQFTKYWTVENIPLHGQLEGISGLFRLTYVQNTGAAFSAFKGMQWLFILIFAVFTLFLILEFATNRCGFTRLEHWLLTAVYAGGLGNMIDRLRLGYVVDMIELEFMEFPVFNVADCFITCGCIALLVHLLLFNKAFWKDEKK